MLKLDPVGEGSQHFRPTKTDRPRPTKSYFQPLFFIQSDQPSEIEAEEIIQSASQGLLYFTRT